MASVAHAREASVVTRSRPRVNDEAMALRVRLTNPSHIKDVCEALAQIFMDRRLRMSSPLSVGELRVLPKYPKPMLLPTVIAFDAVCGRFPLHKLGLAR
jgi:hypothetical protein